MEKIAIIGLGYVGLPLAVEFGKIRDVIGFDINEGRINELINGKDSTLEVDKEELASAQALQFSSNPDDLHDAQIFIVTVPTVMIDLYNVSTLSAISGLLPLVTFTMLVNL